MTVPVTGTRRDIARPGGRRAADFAIAAPMPDQVMTTEPRNDIYSRVTDRILADLAKGFVRG